MTRSELLRAVAHIVETVDKYVEDSPYTDDLQQLRDIFGAGEDEYITDAARRVVANSEHLADAVRQTATDLKEANRCIESLRAFPPESDHVRDALGAAENETTLAAARRVRSERDNLRESGDDAIADERVERAMSKVRDALSAPIGEDTAVVAERRMEAIRGLVKKLDDQDRDIAQALDGLFPGDDAPTAVKKLVGLYRRDAAECVRLKEKLERLGV